MPRISNMRMYDKDKDLYKIFRLSSAMSHEQMNNYIKDRRIKEYVKRDYIQKIADTKREGYRITLKGKKKFESEFGKEGKWYKHQNLRHDLALADSVINVYNSCPEVQFFSEADLHTWNNEDGNSVTDFAYKVDNQVYGYEIETSTYKQTEINSKKNFCSNNNMQYVSRRI